ncbi:MAG: efflux RND transporter permease subunit [Eubacteriales bacterium]|jgi:HAE1 family hydrophobic/amphiphilic exporter-1|nr:efflux RND transporter permease subunit [Eubacteriales bacterium]
MKWSLSKITIARPVATIMITLMVVVLGVSAILSIPKDLMPNIELPVAMVITSYPNASPEEVEAMVTQPVEQALASVENLDEMMSYSMEGMSIVVITFQMNNDMNFATLNMREKIAPITDYLPSGVSDPMVMKLDMNTMPVMQVYVSADIPLDELTTRLEDQVVPYFERSSGVASVSVYGGVQEEIAIEFNQETLLGYGLNLSTVAQILAAENINLPSGDVSKGSTQVIVRTLGEFGSVDELVNLPITVADRSILRLGDVATITRGIKEIDSITRIDGKTAIGIMISKQSDANTVQVSKGLNKELKELQKTFPELNFSVGYDQADFINSSISSVAQAAITGGILAIFVVFLFLRNVKSTLVIALSIPVSLLATFAVMHFRNITLNLITLSALTLAVGMLVDNSIVVLENIFRLRTQAHSAAEASEKGSAEIFVAILASTLTTIMVFLPIALTEGMASMMFSEFCFTMIIALLASLVVALTVVPMLCSKLLRGNISTTYARFGQRRYVYRFVPRFALYLERITEGYEKLIRKALSARKKVLVTSVWIFIISSILLVFVGWELLPQADEGVVSVDAEIPYGTSLADKDAIMSQIENYVLTLPELEHVSMSTAGLSMMAMTRNATMTINLVDRGDRNRSSREVADDIRQHLSEMSGAKLTVSADSSITSMFGSNDISLMILGKDYATLEVIGNQLLERINELPEIAHAELDVKEGNPEIRVVIDRNAAAHYGITAYQMANGLSSSLSGTKATDVTIDGEEIEVNLSLRDDYAQSVENMKQIVVTGSYGIPVSIGQIASFEYDNAPSVINRYNQQNYITINAEVVGSDLEGASSAIERILSSYAFPDGYYHEMSGLASEMMGAFGSLAKALIVSIALVFLLLAAQFESPLMAIIVMMAVPFAMSGAFLAMFVTGVALSMTSFLGLIMLVGIVVNNSILLVEFIRHNEAALGKTEALVMAGKLRLRPILMTSATTCFGMIPLSLGIGEGGEMLAPMGISIIGGLTASTAITLVLVPSIYSLIDERKTRREERRAEKRLKVKELERQWAEADRAANKG